MMFRVMAGRMYCGMLLVTAFRTHRFTNRYGEEIGMSKTLHRLSQYSSLRLERIS